MANFVVATNFGTTGQRLTTAGDSTTGWSGGGAEPDFRYQGSYSYSVLVKTSEGGVDYTHASTKNFTTGRLVAHVKIIATNKDVLDGDGVQVWIGNDSSNAYSWFVFTSSTYPIPGGFQVVCIDPQVSTGPITRNTEGTAPSMSAIDYFAFRADFSATAKSENFAADAIEVIENGKGLIGTGSDTTGTFTSFVTYDEGTVGNRYGVVQTRGGIIYVNGVLKIGSTAQTAFTDANKVIVFPDHIVTTGFCGLDLDISHASTVISITNSFFSGRGSLYSSDDRRPDYEVIGSSGSLTLDGCTFNVYRAITLNSAVSAVGCTFLNGLIIYADGADLTGSTVSGLTTAADGWALEWDVASDPDGELDDMTFVKGTNAHHAIGFGTSAPTTMTLRGITFSGFNASNGQNDSVLYFPDTGSDVTWNVSAVGCTGTVSYKKARSGDTVNITVDPVTLTVHVQDIVTQADVSGARVLVEVASAIGGWPYLDSVSIVQSAGTATVTHTGHGLATNDWVVIRGASPDAYNGVKKITVTGADTYTFSIGSGTSSPATGSITSTLAIIPTGTSETTDANGDISGTRTYSADQPITGRVRSASGLPYYKPAPISGEIDSTTGLAVTVALIRDY